MPDSPHGEYPGLLSNLSQDTGYLVSLVTGSSYCLQAVAWVLVPSASRSLHVTIFTVYRVPVPSSFQAVPY